MNTTPADQLRQLDRWIAARLERDGPCASDLLRTILCGGACADGPAWLSSLIRLMAPFGVRERLVRTSVFRLAQHGVIRASRVGRRSSYSLAPHGIAAQRRMQHLLATPVHEEWDGGWTLVVAVDGVLRSTRYAALRAELEAEGFRMLVPNLMAHPSASGGAAAARASQLHLSEQLLIWHAKALPMSGVVPLCELAAHAWHPAAVGAAYDRFSEQFCHLLAMLDGDLMITLEQAYALHTLVTQAYLKVALTDPRLPLPLLPAPWAGVRARAVLNALELRVRPGAAEYIARTLSDDNDSPASDACLLSAA